MLSADIFSKSTFSKKNFRNIFGASNNLDPDQARRFVGPDLGPNCVQMLSADDTSRQRVLSYHIILELVGIAFEKRRIKGDDLNIP